MSRRRDPDEYRALGDRLLRRGRLRLAALAYTRWADACLAERYLARARELARVAPLEALAALARVEQLAGASSEGWVLAAQSYEALGETQVARRFRSVRWASGAR